MKQYELTGPLKVLGTHRVPGPTEKHWETLLYRIYPEPQRKSKKWHGNFILDMKVLKAWFTKCIYSIMKTIKEIHNKTDWKDCTRIFSSHVWVIGGRSTGDFPSLLLIFSKLFNKVVLFFL